MAARPVIKFYLAHAETGQRYAIADVEVVLGRASGDILFRDDQSLAPAHARIFPRGDDLHIQNLAAAATVTVNAAAVAANHVVAIKDGDRVTVGAQSFRLEEVKRSKPKPPRTRTSAATKQPARGQWLNHGVVVSLVIAAIGVIGYAFTTRPAQNTFTPTFAEVDREVEGLLATYRSIGAGPEDQIAARLRRDLIPGLERAERRLGEVIVAAEPQRRDLAGRRRLVGVLARQTRAMASYYETGDPDVGRALEAATRELASVQLGTRRAKLSSDELSTAPPPRK